jgi:hypothetical protein
MVGVTETVRVGDVELRSFTTPVTVDTTVWMPATPVPWEGQHPRVLPVVKRAPGLVSQTNTTPSADAMCEMEREPDLLHSIPLPESLWHHLVEPR